MAVAQMLYSWNMTDTKTQRPEKWLLWTYGVLSMVLLPVFQVIDALVTDAPEPWHRNFSFILIATGSVALTGILLLVPFKQPFAVLISICTSLLIWPLVWVADRAASAVVGVLGLSGEHMLIVLLVCIGGVIIILPPTLGYIAGIVKRNI